MNERIRYEKAQAEITMFDSLECEMFVKSGTGTDEGTECANYGEGDGRTCNNVDKLDPYDTHCYNFYDCGVINGSICYQDRFVCVSFKFCYGVQIGG